MLAWQFACGFAFMPAWFRELRIFYGNKVHYLCTKAGVGEVRQIMGSMSHVVEAMLERLRVDLPKGPCTQ